MKKHLLMAVLGALSFSAYAQDVSEVDTVNISPELRITVPAKIYRMSPDQFYQFKGAYELSNGMTLSLFNRGHWMYAQLNDGERHEIVATSHNAFVAKDQQLQMTIDLHDNGDVSGELLMVVPGKTAQNSEIGVPQLLTIAMH
jgi:hypothetical protein